MSLKNSALVLEGGGLRGIFAAGVIRFLMEKSLYLPYVIGVSSGACNGSNYVSQQKDRNRVVNIDFVKDKRYLSYRQLLSKGELFGMQFLFDTLPNQLAPFDFDTFHSSDQKMVTGVSDCITGNPVYYNQFEHVTEYLSILKASCSLPMLAPPVKLDGKILMDGGISDAIPLKKSILDGNKKHVLLLTQPIGYRKKPARFLKLVNKKYPEFKGLQQALADRHQRYNALLEEIESLEKNGDIFVIRPPKYLKIKRVERSIKKLNIGYEQGLKDASQRYKALCEYLEIN